MRFLDPYIQNETLIVDLNRTTPVKLQGKSSAPKVKLT
jgi:hypothetical protein